MKKDFQLNRTDSRFFGQNMVTWDIAETLSPAMLLKKESEIIETYDPAMICTLLPLHDVVGIGNFLERNYRFVECRLLVEKEPGNKQYSYNLYPYEFELVDSTAQLSRLIKLCGQMSFDDRFFNDPEVDNKLALQRNIYFLKQSYKRRNEFIYLLKNANSKEILGFRSFKVNSKFEVSMLISATLKEKQSENIPELINLLELELMVENDIRLIKAVISAQNFDEINRYVARYDYTIKDSKVILHKILKPLVLSLVQPVV